MLSSVPCPYHHLVSVLCSHLCVFSSIPRPPLCVLSAVLCPHPCILMCTLCSHLHPCPQVSVLIPMSSAPTAGSLWNPEGAWVPKSPVPLPWAGTSACVCPPASLRVWRGLGGTQRVRSLAVREVSVGRPLISSLRGSQEPWGLVRSCPHVLPGGLGCGEEGRHTQGREGWSSWK